MLIVFRRIVYLIMVIIVLSCGFTGSKWASLVKDISKLLNSIAIYLSNWAIATLRDLIKFYFYCTDIVWERYSSYMEIKIWDFLSTPGSFMYTTMFLFLVSTITFSSSYYKKTCGWSLLCVLFIHTQHYLALVLVLPGGLQLYYCLVALVLASYIIWWSFLDLTHSNILDRLCFWCLYVEIVKVLLYLERPTYLSLAILLENVTVLDFVKLMTQFIVVYMLYTYLKKYNEPWLVFVFCMVAWSAFTIDITLLADLSDESFETLRSFWTPPNVWLVLLLFIVVVALLRLKEWLRK